MTRTRLLSLAALLVGSPVFAAGSDTTPPTPTQTTTVCPEGAVWDEDRSVCVLVEESRFDPERLMENVRELAYAERYDDAVTLLGMAADPEDTMVLTYLGFTHRRMGDMEAGLAFYERALDVDPDNLLARSYMGMGFVESGDMALARFELAQIQQRGGTGSWPERALADAIATGQTINY